MKKYLTISQRIKKLKEILKEIPKEEKQEYERQLKEAQEQQKRETFNFKAKEQNSEINSIKNLIREPPSHENTESIDNYTPQIESQAEIENRILNLFPNLLRCA